MIYQFSTQYNHLEVGDVIVVYTQTITRRKECVSLYKYYQKAGWRSFANYVWRVKDLKVPQDFR